jgi:hypothetical protein
MPAKVVASGHFGNALEFNGNSEAVFPLDKALRLSRGTVEMWVRLGQIPAGVPCSASFLRVGHPDAAPVLQFGFQQQKEPIKDANGKPTAKVRWLQSVGGVPLAEPWKTGAWHHVAQVWDGVSQTVYVDGRRLGERRQGTGNGRLHALADARLETTVVVGGNTWPPWDKLQRMPVVLDEICVYSWALAPADVAVAAKREAGKPLAFPRRAEFVVEVEAWAPGEQAVLALVDCYHLPRMHEVARVRLEILNRNGRTVGKEVMANLPDRLEQKVIRAERLPPGDYRLKATAEDTAGRLLATATSATHTIKYYPWLFNHLGETTGVPDPWTPVKAAPTADGADLAVWGRTMHVGPNGLPSSIRSNEKELLAGPIHLAWSKGANAGAFEAGRLQVTPVGAGRAEWTTTAGRLAGAEATVHGWIEYDGVLHLMVALEPGARPLDLDYLTLEVPVRPEHSKLVHGVGWDTFWWFGHKRLLSPDPGVVFRSRDFRQPQDPDFFSPYVFIADDDRGLAWFAENPRNWRNDSRNELVIERDLDGVARLRVPLINVPTRLRGRTEYSFGFLATPVKPLPPRWRSWVFGLDYFLPDKRRDYARQKVYRWIWGDSAHPEMDYDSHGGFKAGPNDPTGDKWVAYWGGDFDKKLPPKTFGGWGYPVPYLDAHIVAPPAWPDNSHDDFAAEMNSDGWMMSPSQGFVDLYLWRLAHPWLDRKSVGGFYVDEPYGRSSGWSLNPFVGSYYDAQGRLHPSWTLLRQREFFKRMLLVQRQFDLPGMTWVHMTANYYPHAFTHVTAIMDGEIGSGLTGTDQDIIGYWIRGWMRSADRGANSGLVPLNMGSNIRTDTPVYWRPYAGLLYSHDVNNVWAQECWNHNARAELCRVDFDVAASDVRFVGYWDNTMATVRLVSGASAPRPATDLIASIFQATDAKGKLTGKPKDKDNPYRVFVSLLKRSDKALICVLNYNTEPIKGNLELDQHWWRFVKEWGVTDGESGAAIPCSRRAIPFDVGRWDYQLIWVGPRAGQ